MSFSYGSFQFAMYGIWAFGHFAEGEWWFEPPIFLNNERNIVEAKFPGAKAYKLWVQKDQQAVVYPTLAGVPAAPSAFLNDTEINFLTGKGIPLVLPN